LDGSRTSAEKVLQLLPLMDDRVVIATNDAIQDAPHIYFAGMHIDELSLQSIESAAEAVENGHNVA